MTGAKGMARDFRISGQLIAVGCVLGLTTFAKMSLAPDRPLWIDEVWTGMIASQTSLRDFFHRCASDINAPLYYIIAALWAKIAGISDLALRMPALVASVAAPLVALVSERIVGRRVGRIWCVLLACWVPGAVLALEARYYSLYFFLGCVNTALFVWLVTAPSTRRALAWSSVSCLLILSHYYGFILAGIQGLVYLALWRERAVRTWPAALAFLPAFASLGVHAFVLLRFSQAGVSWIPLTGPADILPVLSFAFGPLALLAYTIVWIAACGISVAIYRGVGAQRPDDGADFRGLLLAVACAAGATALAWGLGLFRPIFVLRYISGFVPGLLLGLALLADRAAGYWARAPLFLLAGHVVMMVKIILTSAVSVPALQFETATDDLIDHAPRRLVFMWDNPMLRSAKADRDDEALRGVAGFFFSRAGKAVDIALVDPVAGADPNVQLLDNAVTPGDVILWLYDLGVVGTGAVRHPPRIPQLDPAWACRDFGSGGIGVIGCHRRERSTSDRYASRKQGY